MKILVHMPTRGRAGQARRTIEGYLANCTNTTEIAFSVACNEAADMPQVPEFDYLPIVHPFGSKIAAYNSVPTDIEWDVVLAASDDMWCVQEGWDSIIEEEMQRFPDTDGGLWFYDGRQNEICTFSIIGRKAFEDFGYVYHPQYKSYWCDNEYTEVMQATGRIHKDTRMLFRNEHPTWGGVMPVDQTYRATTKHFVEDKRTYFRRKADGFPK